MEVEEKKTKEEMEEEIAKAMRARVRDFKKQADSLTLEGVRRALEKDLGMKTFSLDVHKRFIKQCLEECFYGAEDETNSDTSGKTQEGANQSAKKEYEELQPSVELKNDTSGFVEQTEEPSAVDEKKPAEHETERDQASKLHSDLNEEMIKNSIKKRASYFRANLESISLQEVRRMLEEDLQLEKKALDAYKSFISKELEEILQSPEVKPANGVKKNLKKGSQKANDEKTRKSSKRTCQKSDSSDSNDSISDDEEDEEIRPKKGAVEKVKASTKGPKRQKISTENKKSSGTKEKKLIEPDLDRSSEDKSGHSSEDDHSHSSAEEDVKKKREKPTQAYGRQVEHLKSIIKSCGMGIPPSVYRRVKQAPESKREAYLVKELEEILDKEGLSINPSEKDIKAVKKRKERAKELEGIDMSNIVSSSRRRTTSSYIPPPKPKVEVESDDDSEDEDDEEDEENEEDSDGGDNGGGDASEGSDEDAEDESD